MQAEKDNFFNKLEDILEKVLPQRNVILIGDFNGQAGNKDIEW